MGSPAHASESRKRPGRLPARGLRPAGLPARRLRRTPRLRPDRLRPAERIQPGRLRPAGLHTAARCLRPGRLPARRLRPAARWAPTRAATSPAATGQPGGYDQQGYGQQPGGYDQGGYQPAGYGQPQPAYAAPQSYAPTAITLLLEDGSNRTFALREGSNVVGRGQDAQFRLP